jgi:ferric-dicitrate binding protein FerR (iron transport regulator)
MHRKLGHELEKLRSGKLTEKESRDILSSFHQAGLEYGLKNELYRQLENSDDAAATENESQLRFDRLWKRIETNKSAGKTFKLSHVYWAAAILLIGFLLGNIMKLDVENVGEPEYYTAVAPMGSVSEIILPDQTVIFLNAGSEIKYASFSGSKTREVFLEGEAYFNVEKSEEIPFIVHTPFYDVQVMGTSFNVKAYAEDAEVVTTLEEGSIQIRETKNFKTEENIVLQPGEQLLYNKQDNLLQIKKVNPVLFSSWKDNKLTFINMALGELFTLLERKYGVTIEVRDKSILKYHYDGTLKNETIIEVLNILQKTLPIRYTMQNEEVIISKK